MEVIYSFMELLPVSMFQYDFMKNAFLASVLIAPLFALLGTMAVNNKMAFLYNQFKDNILFPIRDIVNKPNGRVDLEEIIHIHNVINLVEKPQLPFSRVQNLLYEKMERWFVKESEYVNNVLLANVTSVNATSMEEKLAITTAYNYILSNILPEFHRIVDNIIPADHSMNTRLRMMFSGKFIVLANASAYLETAAE